MPDWTTKQMIRAITGPDASIGCQDQVPRTYSGGLAEAVGSGASRSISWSSADRLPEMLWACDSAAAARPEAVLVRLRQRPDAGRRVAGGHVAGAASSADWSPDGLRSPSSALSESGPTLMSTSFMTDLKRASSDIAASSRAMISAVVILTSDWACCGIFTYTRSARSACPDPTARRAAGRLARVRRGEESAQL